MQLWETGLNRVWVEGLVPRNADKCFVKNNDQPESKIRLVKMTLEDLTGAFFILGVGICFSLVCFIIEIVASRY